MQHLTTERLMVRQIRRSDKPDVRRHSKAARHYLENLQDTYQAQLAREMRLIQFPDHYSREEDDRHAS
ncbi:MAG: hypothetical protein AB2L14_07035 [Candidatus Xenobiia bacterium LiM19]